MVKPRKVIVIDKGTTMSTGVVKPEIKVENFPKEVITACTFPLTNINVVLDLSWL